MEAEITPPPATNGPATSTNGIAMTEDENVAAGELARGEVDVNERVEDAAEIIDYLEEGAANTEEEGEMGEAEYLEGEMPDDDCVDERELVDEDVCAAEANKVSALGQQEQAGGKTEDQEIVYDDATEILAVAEVDVVSAGETDEGELITGDDTQPDTLGQHTEEDDAASSVRSGAKKEEGVDENQCRVCTSKEDLVSLFKKTGLATPADMLLVICPNVSIAQKDYMPQFICNGCLESVTIAIQLKNQLETTERDLRKRLSRSKNKVRRPRGYVVIDAPVSDSATEEEEPNDDVEFKVSDVAGSTSGDSDSADSDISDKRKRPGRRRQRKKSLKRAAGSISGSNDDDAVNAQKKKCLTQVAGQGPFECDQCDLSFSRKHSYVLHRKMHSRHEITCKICGKKFKRDSAYKAHMERHEMERFQCEVCHDVFKLRTDMKRHMSTMHDEHGLVFECKRCHRTFFSESRLQRHQTTNCSRFQQTTTVSKRSTNDSAAQGRDLFKSVAPLTTTYWSDSFSD